MFGLSCLLELLTEQDRHIAICYCSHRGASHVVGDDRLLAEEIVVDHVADDVAVHRDRDAADYEDEELGRIKFWIVP